MKLNKIMIGIGILLIVFIPIWLFLIVPELLKMPNNFEREFNLYYVLDTNYDLSEWTGESLANGFNSDKTILSNSKELTVKSHYKADTQKGELIWETDNDFVIDRKTRENKNKEGYLILPSKIKKKTYKFWPMGYNYAFDLKFNGIESLRGLEVYKFSFRDAVTEDTEAYSWLEFVPEKYDVESIQSTELLIEPVSGIIVNYKDAGKSYYLDKETGEKVQDFYKWQDNFKDDTIANQVRLAQNEKQKIYLIEWIIPILLGLVGIALIFASFIGRKFMHKEEKPEVKPIIPKK